MREFFGTDGIRGLANNYPLTPEFIIKLAKAASRVLPNEKGRVLIGRDSRISGPMLESALDAGFLSQGREVVHVGIVPTPAISYLTEKYDFDFGVMISASHNPVNDNGIKLFNGNGLKLNDMLEIKIENEIKNMLEQETVKNNVKIKQSIFDNRLVDKYIEHVLKVSSVNLSGMKIVCDAAWGSAAPWALQLFTSAGADTIVINGKADGNLINVDCGSTNTSKLSKVVLKSKSDLGLAFDGDADRLIAVDENGSEVDGDGIKYIFTTYLDKKGLLKNKKIVGTVMSNLGLEKALAKKGISLIRTQVGDRYVWQEMQKSRINLGGEQSGHIINSDWQNTGDGLLNGLMLASILKESNVSLSQALKGFSKYPQKLINVEVKNKQAIMQKSELISFVEDIHRELLNKGRLVLRPSGTQSIIRVMVEAETMDMTNYYVNKVADKVREISNKKQ